MNEYLDRLEAQFSELSSKISHLEPLNDQPKKFSELDKELVTQVAEIREHYALCREIERVQTEGQQLDNSINSILVQLDECRRQLESSPAKVASATSTSKVNAQTLLDYATKITRFTRKMPGSVDPSILPWPAEDQLRRGMLATFTIQDEQQMEASLNPQEDQEPAAVTSPSIGGSSAGADAGADADASASSNSHIESLPKDNASPQRPGSGDKPKRPAVQRPKQKISLDFDSDED